MIPQPPVQAPAFSLPDQTATTRSLSDYRGKWVVLYFYPKDFTGGCTLEAQGFRDEWSAYRKRDIVILGISPDDATSHQKFCDEYKLPFTLLADVGHKVAELYGVWQLKKMMGKEFMGVVRTTFLIKPDGAIAKTYEKVSPEGHPKAVIEDFDAMQ